VEFVASKTTEDGDWVAVTGVKSNAKNGEPDTIEAIQVGVLSAQSRRLYGQEAFIENGNRGYLGIVFEIGDAKNTKIDEVKNEGARRAGLKKGDAIVGVDTTTIENREDIFKFMNETKPGQSIQVKVKRKDGKGGDDETLTFKFNTIHSALMDRGTMQNTMGGSLSDRRTGFPKVIQHDTRLLPRECGGPLVDLEGRVIGLNIARAGRVESWALPADTIKTALKELQDGKHPFPKPAEVAKKPDPKDAKDVKGETKEK
jgi:serine protease Do